MKTILHIYTRVSSVAQQEEGTSLENQKQLGIKKSVELGFDSRLWNEGGQSSFNDDFKNRPVLVGLLSLIETGTVKHLFVYNTDRLSRNQQTWAVIRYKLLTYGVTLHSASGQMTLKNPVDDLMLGILSEISQYDNRIRAERSRLGRFYKIQQGNWKGGPPPFGYCLERKQLKIEPFESNWVQKMFNWYCCGVSVKEIQYRLSRQGVITRRGNTQWSLGSIQLVLRNSVYVGYYDYTDKMIGQTVRIQSPPIIDSQLFQNTLDRRQANRDRNPQVNQIKNFYLLRGLLVCGHCGTSMGGRTNNAGRQNLYYCMKKERSWKTRGEQHSKWIRGRDCSMIRSVNMPKTDKVVWGMIESVMEEIRDRLPKQSEVNHSSLTILHDIEGLHVNGIGSDLESNYVDSDTYSRLSREKDDVMSVLHHFSPNQFDSLSNDVKKVIVNILISKVSVFFDAATSKHRLEIQFSEEVSRLLEEDNSQLNDTDNVDETYSECLESFGEDTGDVQGRVAGKKFDGSWMVPATVQDYSVTVE